MITESRKRASVGATLLFAIIATFTMVAGASPASATPTHLDLGVVSLGDITVEYLPEFDRVLLELITETSLWVITGGEEDIPAADVTFHIDLVDLDHLQMLLVEVFLHNANGCTVTFHGPLLLNSIDGNEYHGDFAKSELGGILYSSCDQFLTGLILSTINTNGVLVLFHLS